MRQQQAKFQIRRHENDFLDRSLLSHNRERQASAYPAAPKRITTILPDDYFPAQIAETCMAASYTEIWL
jgi:hypothetical protein